MTDDLLYKSQINMDVADELRKGGYWDSACHPMYYACLQLITHKLLKSGITLESQGSESIYLIINTLIISNLFILQFKVV